MDPTRTSSPDVVPPAPPAAPAEPAGTLPDASPVDADVEFLRTLAAKDPQVRKRVFTVLLRAVVSGRGAGR